MAGGHREAPGWLSEAIGVTVIFGGLIGAIWAYVEKLVG